MPNGYMSIDALVSSSCNNDPSPSYSHLSSPIYQDSFDQASTLPSPPAEHSSLPKKLSMSLDERRRRNKIASARYRAKKQEKVKAMSSKVNQLMAVNANLQKSLEIVKLENGALRRLVQSLMAQKEASTKHLPQS